jgi:formate hydrogenlyase subunit 3/multisubunit Na+/H+ antiporter MnhD subunit
MTALFVLAIAGFGLKAGMMPLHVWLPGAHANAPSHVSAMMSGVMLKAGVYGVARAAGLMPHPPVQWGSTLLVIGACSAVVGISFAAAQRDMKRLLAYSSIENVGIMILGIGLATLGRSLDRMDWVVLGLGAALFHVLNHGVFKPLLFMAAGGIVHATGTRDMDRLGGLQRKMPLTFVLSLIGAIAISGLPPLNGFASELLLYVGLFKTVSLSAHWAWLGLGAPALALAGALAVGAFVKLLGTVFAGSARSGHADHAHDPDATMLAPMAVLAAACVLLGAAPKLLVPLLDRAVAAWSPRTSTPIESIAAYVPLGWLTVVALALLAAVISAERWLSRRRMKSPPRAAGTWDCGYARPTPRMQYTGSSFSQMIVQQLAWVLWPRQRPTRITGVFAAPTKFSSDVPDVVLDRGLVPGFRAAEWLLGWARLFQRGPIQMYLLYVLAALVLLLLLA